MKKALVILATSFLLVSCSSDETGKESVNESVQDETAKQVLESQLQDSGGNPEALLEAQERAAEDLRLVYSEKETTPLEDGLYENKTLINGSLFTMTMLVDKGNIIKSSSSPQGYNKGEFKGSAKYEYSGNVLKYTDVKGDNFLFNPSGDAFIKTKTGFSFVEICDSELKKAIPTLEEMKGTDTYCEEGIMLSIYEKV